MAIFRTKTKSNPVVRFTLCRDPEFGKYEITEYSDGTKKYTYFEHPEKNRIERGSSQKAFSVSRPIIYDKASWHIDNGESKKQVLDHFRFFMNWLSDNDLLSEDGKEIENLKIDDSISIHSGMLNDKGNSFMERFYNNFIESQEKDRKALDNTLKSGRLRLFSE